MENIKDQRVIKRYSNRKMYDTVDSSYITLEEIASLLKNGHEIKVVDNKTGEDLTSVTFAQILLEEEKKNKGRFSPAKLKSLLVGTGEVIGERVGFVQDRAQKMKSNVEKLGSEYIKKLMDEQASLKERIALLEEKLLQKTKITKTTKSNGQVAPSKRKAKSANKTSKPMKAAKVSKSMKSGPQKTSRQSNKK